MSNWVLEKSPGKLPEVTDQECIDLVTKMLDHEIFVYRNNSTVKSEDELMRIRAIQLRVREKFGLPS